MDTLTIYGKPSYSYNVLKQSILKTIKKANLKLKINEVQDITQFMDEKLKAIPALKFKDKLTCKEDKTLISFIQEVNQEILESAGYGSMTIINVPIDYSEASLNALAYAQSLSRKINGIIQAVFVYKPSNLTDDEQSAFEFHKQYISKLNNSSKLFNRNSIPIISKFEVGFPADKLIEISTNDSEQLIVMGTKKENKTQKKWLDSISTKVAKESKAVTILIPTDGRYNSIKNVAYFSNNTLLDQKVYEKIPQLILDQQPNIHLTCIGEKQGSGTLPALNCIKNGYNPETLKEVFIDNDVQKIEEYFNKEEIDLIVIPREKMSFFDALLKTSFSKKMILNSKIPVMIINN